MNKVEWGLVGMLTTGLTSVKFFRTLICTQLIRKGVEQCFQGG